MGSMEPPLEDSSNFSGKIIVVNNHYVLTLHSLISIVLSIITDIKITVLLEKELI